MNSDNYPWKNISVYSYVSVTVITQTLTLLTLLYSQHPTREIFDSLEAKAFKATSCDYFTL